MDWKRQKASWEHEKSQFCNEIGKCRTQVEYVPLTLSLYVISVDLHVGILYMSYSTHNYDRQTAATCHIRACVAPSHLERSKSSDF